MRKTYQHPVVETENLEVAEALLNGLLAPSAGGPVVAPKRMPEEPERPAI